MRIVSEEEFREALVALLGASDTSSVGSVTGPGRSGAIAAVYVSHLLHIPFIPYGSVVPLDLGCLMIADTASESGRTMRKAMHRYKDASPYALIVFQEPPRVAFWYEAPKPQRFRHEKARL